VSFSKNCSFLPPHVLGRSLFNCTSFVSYKNNVNLARLEVGLVGTRVWETDKTELIVNGRGTGVCVTSGIVRESNLRRPREIKPRQGRPPPLYHSFDIQVLPFGFERQRLFAHLAMVFARRDLRANMFNGSMVLQTSSAKIGTPMPSSNGKNSPWPCVICAVINPSAMAATDDFSAFTSGMVSTASTGYGYLKPVAFRTRGGARWYQTSVLF
jgi:hypothetical protein